MKRSPRWMAEISYLTDRPIAVVAFEEIEDLHPIIERGSNWNEIDKIVITLNRISATPKTEAADGRRD